MKKSLSVLLIISFLFANQACKNEPTVPDETTHQTDTSSVSPKDEIVDEVNEEGRIIWQKPEDVVRMLGDISEKTIADIGAGSGYFTFRFALKAKKVIAIDIDPNMISLLESFKQKLPEEIQAKIETRLALPDDPMIKEGEADIIVIINTIGYIENRKAYLGSLRNSLAENGRILILDFKTKNLPINAPPMEYRVPLGTLENDLLENGYNIIDSDDRTLDYQYILIAGK